MHALEHIVVYRAKFETVKHAVDMCLFADKRWGQTSEISSEHKRLGALRQK
jgi:hypothetical protein